MVKVARSQPLAGIYTDLMLIINKLINNITNVRWLLIKLTSFLSMVCLNKLSKTRVKSLLEKTSCW